MKKTYYYKTFDRLPSMFSELWVPAIWNNDEITVEEDNINNIMTDLRFLELYTIRYFFIKSYKWFTSTKIFTRTGTWDYRITELFKEQQIKFYVFQSENNCIIESTKEAYLQVYRQANSTRQQHNYLNFSNNLIDLNNIINLIDNNNIKWLWIKVEWNPRLTKIRLNGNTSVNESEEAQEALRSWWEIEYIEFMFNNFKIKLYSDYRFSFYTNQNIEADIQLIKDIIELYQI